MGRRSRCAALVLLVVGGCATAPPSTQPSTRPSNPPTDHASAAATPAPTTTGAPRLVHDNAAPVRLGTQIELADLTGRIVTDNFEDVFAFDVDGSNLVMVADQPGAEFDGDWSPDGQWVVYRDSTRGINENDEIFVARKDGAERRNITNDPSNDWGPEWSPDGKAIVFNSDRDGSIKGYLVDPDGSNVRRLPIAGWVEYPTFSPDGTRIAYMGATGSNYELYVADTATGAAVKLTTSPGHDAWAAWSPDGATIAFSSVRDDCRIAPPDQECWPGDGEHYDIWLISPDGSNLRRVNGEYGQFVAWSPSGEYLLISGYALYVVRPDGTGRLELRADGLDRPLGGIPDWWAAGAPG